MCNSSLFEMLSKCFQKFANKTLWSFYHFSKKPLPNFIIFGLRLIHQILQKGAVLKFLETSKSQGAICKTVFVFFAGTASFCVSYAGPSTATSCLPFQDKENPLEPSSSATTPSLSLLSLSLSSPSSS
jgi:hypothetical protein